MIEYPDAWYHVMSWDRIGQKDFLTRDHYSDFIELFMDASEMLNMAIGTYCLMAKTITF